MAVNLQLTVAFSYAAGHQPLQAGDQQRVLHCQHALGQLFGAVAGQYRHPRTGQHRARIQFGHHEVHAGPGFGVAGLQRAGVGVQPL